MEEKKNSNEKKGIIHILSAVPIEEIIDGLLTKYRKNKNLGILDLVQLLLDAAGHETTLTLEVMEKNYPDKIIQHWSETIQSSKEPPIRNREIYVKIVVFFQKLIFNCDSLLFDDFLLVTLFSFVVPMSGSKLRVFRYVGTLVGLKAITALVGVHQAYIIRSLVFEKKLYGQEGKDDNFRSSDHFNQLQEKYFKHKRNEEEIAVVLNDILIKMLFKRRILDKMAEIQIMCLDEAVQWMQICPQTFIVERYLKYYALFASSPSANVRKTVLKSLLYLFKTQTLTHYLQVFVRKHIVDIVNMTLDKLLLISLEALALLTEILKAYGPEILKDHKQLIFLLVLSKHRSVANAAGNFLLTWLKMQDEPRNEEPSNTWILLHLAQFLEQVKRPNHAPYLVEILTYNCGALQDWEAMSYILITQTENMTAEQETCFMKIMSAAIEQSCSEKLLGAKKGRPTISEKEEKLRNEHKLKITQCFAEHFPQLLLKYKDDAERISSLLQISMCLQLEEMATKEQSVNKIVKTLKNLVNIHSDEKVIKGCYEVIEYFISQQPKEEKHEYVKRWSIEENFLEQFIKVADTFMCLHGGNLPPNDDQIFTLESTLEKLVSMFNYKGQEWDKLWDICLNFISHSQECFQLPKTFIVLCIKMCHTIVLSTRVKMEKQPRVVSDEISLQTKLLQFLDVLQQFLTHEIKLFRKSAFFVICDMLLVFCKNGANDFPKLGILADDSLLLLLRKYVEERIFWHSYELNEENLEFGTSVLNAYCKLLSYGMLKIEAGVWIFWYFRKNEKDYADILKKTMKNMLKADYYRTGIYLMNILLHTLEVYMERTYRQKEKDPRKPDTVRKFIHKKVKDFFYLLASNSEAKFYFHKKALILVLGKDTNNRGKIIILDVLSDFINVLTRDQALNLLELFERYENHLFKKSSSEEKYLSCLCKKSQVASLKRKEDLSFNQNKRHPTPITPSRSDGESGVL